MSVWRKLGEIAEFVNGRAFKPDEWEESGVPIIRIQNLNDESKSFNYTTKKLPDTFKVNTGDILFSWSGTPGTSFGCFRWSRETGWLNQHIFNVKFKNDNIFSDYFIRSVNSQLGKIIDQAHGGVGLKHITKKKLLEIEIPLPPLPEQKRIAAILDAADALRTQRRQSIVELDLLLQSTFLEMFGDPVDNPKGWERCELGSFIEVLTDYHANGSYEILREHVQLKNTKDYALMIRTTDLENNTFDSEDNIYIDKHAYEFLVKSQVHGGDIIINKIGSAGKVYLMPNLNKPVSLGMNAFLIRMKPRIGNLFAYFYLTSQYGVSEIDKRVKGAVTKTIRKDAIREIPFYVPSKETQNAFTQLSDAITLQKVWLQAHLAELDTLFASLQQRAFNGEL